MYRPYSDRHFVQSIGAIRSAVVWFQQHMLFECHWLNFAERFSTVTATQVMHNQ